MLGRLFNKQSGGVKGTAYENQRGGILHLSKNEHGRDFVVGDIHGHFELVEQLLKVIDFDKQVDRMISVGDCIDRGPESHRALEFLQKPWFYSIRGNHEAMLMDSVARKYGIYELWMRNGGDWSDLVSEEFLNRMAAKCSELPYAIEIETINGNVGLIHADMPSNLSWPKMAANLASFKLKNKQFQALLWSRDSYNRFRKAREKPDAVIEPEIEGVYRVYVGHSIVNNPCLFGNLMFIDTGAYVTGKLSAVDLNNDEVIMVQNKTKPQKVLECEKSSNYL